MSLHELIARVAAETGVSDPRELAQHVATEVPSNKIRNMFAEAIIDDCRHHLMGRRNKALNAPRRSGGVSHKQQQCRDWWADICAESVHVGGGKYIPVGKCTVNDLDYLIEERETTIERIQKHVNEYKTMRSLMVKHKVIHVEDLPRNAVDKGLAA